MNTEEIQVVEYTTPTITKVLYQFRDETQPTSPQDLTGYTLRLIVKASVDLDDDDAFFELEASIVDEAAGSYMLELKTEHTSIPPGTYPGEIRIWSGSTAVPADDAIPVNFVVRAAVAAG